MRSATPIASAPPPALVRRLVLGSAVALGLAFALAPQPTGVHAQDARPTTPAAPAAAPGTASPTPSPNGAATDAEGGSTTLDIRVEKGKKKSVAVKPGAGITIDDDNPTETVAGATTGKRGKRVHVGVFGDDREFDSFDEFVRTEPGIAFMVVAIVALVFLSPVLAIGLILWYRMRKARMLNETMIKLAEKGVMPPAEALSALTGNPSAAMASPSAAPIYEQAKQIQRRAAWSDLRKGVLVGGFGLGLAFYSMLDDGTPNALGLVLLFVGIGYIVLWWFEDRQATLKGNGAGAATPPPPTGGTGGVA